MKTNDEFEDFDWIDRYLKGELSEEEVVAFNNRLNVDDNFKEDFLQTQQMYKHLDDLRVETIARETLQSLKIKRVIGVPIFIIKKTISFGIAACLVLSMFLINSPVNLPDTENDINVLREIDTTEFTPENRIVYKTFFDGQAHFVSGEYLLASMDFEKVLTINDLREYFKEAAQWHLVLSYYKSNQPNKAEKLYESLSDCDDCEYQVAWLDKWKIWCQIQWQKVRG